MLPMTRPDPAESWRSAPPFLAPATGAADIVGLMQLSDRYDGEFTAEDEEVLVQLAPRQLGDEERYERAFADSTEEGGGP